MHKLLEFLVEKRHWLLFSLCEIISFVLIYRNNAYQRNMMLSSANVVVGHISSASNAVSSYLHLQKANQELLERNASLEQEVLHLRDKIEAMALDTLSFGQVFLEDTVQTDTLQRDYVYEYITAKVVNNSTTYVNNYITIDKGYADGVRPDMGVVSPSGVAGIVMTAKSHYSVLISLLNTKSKISCRVKNTNFFGALSWKGGSPEYAYLEELPTHAVFGIGDTIITSGYSTVFPPGIMVGIVDSYDKQHDDNFYSLKVRLATKFQSLRVLCVIKNNAQAERMEIEREAKSDE